MIRAFYFCLISFIALLFNTVHSAQESYVSEALTAPVYQSIENTIPIFHLIAGQKIKVIDSQGQWAKIEVNSQQVWIKRDFISTSLSRLVRIQQLQKSTQDYQNKLLNKDAEIEFLNQKLLKTQKKITQQNHRIIELASKIEYLTSTDKEKLQKQIDNLTSSIEFNQMDQEIANQTYRKFIKDERNTWVTLLVIFSAISF